VRGYSLSIVETFARVMMIRGLSDQTTDWWAGLAA